MASGEDESQSYALIDVAPSLSEILSRNGLRGEQLQQECPEDVRMEIGTRIIRWYLVGRHLHISNEKLQAISRDHDSEDERKLAMLEEWHQREGSSATYFKLASALHKHGRSDLVDLLCRKLISSFRNEVSTDVCVRVAERGESMHRSNMEDIKIRFETLVQDVLQALKAKGVAAKNVHQVLAGMYTDLSDSIPKNNVDEIFAVAKRLRLWDFMHHSPVEKLVRRLVPDHVLKVTEYKQTLSGFCTTIKLIDFICCQNIECETGNNELPLENYSRNHYQRLRVKLEIDRNITDISLKYVMDLWEQFAEEFHIPFLTAVIDRILEGSLNIVWLIPSIATTIIRESSPNSWTFFKDNHITFVAIDDFVLYDASRMHDMVSC